MAHRHPQLRLPALAAFFSFFLLASNAQAAALYFTPDAGTYRPGDTAAFDLRIDTQGECVNAAEVNIGYPRDTVEIVDVSRGDSIFPIWIVPPEAKPQFGLVTMIGGIPGGYCGRTPGDPSLTNVIAKLIVRFLGDKDQPPTPVRIAVLNTSHVVLNDGRGTEAKLVPRAADLVIDPSGIPRPNPWTEALLGDKTEPEPFTVEIHRDRSIFEGRWFAVFSTVDKQTGVDHYEVAESRERDPDRTELQFKAAESPYVIEDQNLRSTIYVKAVDKAGNARIVERVPEAAPQNKLFYWLVGAAAVFFIILRLLRLIPI